jgi:primary-amine oxidase
VLWDRMDPVTYERDTRRGRELVVTSAYANGNYTYIVEYAFGMDGGIRVQASGNGTTLNRGTDSVEEGEQYGTAVTPTIAAPTHQHFFSFRIDFDVDGPKDRVMEEGERADDTPTGNAFVTTEDELTTEGPRDVDPASGRRWVIESSDHLNALGRPTAYELMPGDVAYPFSGPDYGPLQRALFATHPLWVTRYHDGELYASGDYPNQTVDGQGLPRYVADAESIQDQDVVLWYTAAFTHKPEVEDYPVMTPDTVRFSIEPSGFFDRDPAIGAP